MQSTVIPSVPAPPLKFAFHLLAVAAITSMAATWVCVALAVLALVVLADNMAATLTAAGGRS